MCINNLHVELITPRHQMAELMNIEPNEKLTRPPKLCSKQGGGPLNVAEDADHPQHAQGKAIVATGGKFIIMYMLWMGNIPATFQTELTPAYKPMGHFQNGLEGKQQGEQADLWKVFPRKLPLECHGNLLYQHVCFSLSFILVLKFISVSKGHEY